MLVELSVVERLVDSWFQLSVVGAGLLMMGPEASAVRDQVNGIFRGIGYLPGLRLATSEISITTHMIPDSTLCHIREHDTSRRRSGL
jgi:hypothetical protein